MGHSNVYPYVFLQGPGGVVVRALGCRPLKMIQNTLCVLIHFHTGGVHTHHNVLRPQQEHTDEGPVMLFIRDIHEQPIPCRETILVRAIECWIWLTEFLGNH